MFARRDLFPPLAGESRVLHSVPDGVLEEFVTGIEPLVSSRGIDIVQERLTDTKIDLNNLRLIALFGGILIRHIPVIHA